MAFNEFPSSKPAIHVPNWALILVFLAYALPGNLGHVPWRGDDALHIGVAYSMLQEGNWLWPQIAGQPFYDWGPLTYWLGAATGSLLGWLLPLHDAIRLANVFALTALVWFLRFAARELYGRESASAAAMLTLGSLGLLIHAHEMQPQIFLAASLAANLYGVALLRNGQQRGAWIAGAAAGAAFLTAGISGLFLTLPLWLLQPLCLESGCMRKSLSAQFRIILSSCLLVLAWPLALAIWQPEFLSAWWLHELNNSLPQIDKLQRIREMGNLIGWFSWPLWPIALLSLWRRWGKLRNFGHALPLLSIGLGFMLVLGTDSLRPANMLPLLPPLIIMAAGELCHLRRGAANAFDWFGVITFCLLGLGLWVAWCALHFGWPAPLARNILRLLPGFQPHWTLLELLIALGLSIAWIIALVRLPFFQLRGAVHWALGVTLSWGLATTLWLPWFDYDKNYGPVASEISQAITRLAVPGCISGIDLGEAQRAALLYFAQLKIAPRAANCGLRLAYARGQNAIPDPGEEWQPAWQAERGHGRLSERFILYRRAD